MGSCIRACRQFIGRQSNQVEPKNNDLQSSNGLFNQISSPAVKKIIKKVAIEFCLEENTLLFQGSSMKLIAYLTVLLVFGRIFCLAEEIKIIVLGTIFSLLLIDSIVYLAKTLWGLHSQKSVQRQYLLRVRQMKKISNKPIETFFFNSPQILQMDHTQITSYLKKQFRKQKSSCQRLQAIGGIIILVTIVGGVYLIPPITNYTSGLVKVFWYIVMLVELIWLIIVKVEAYKIQNLLIKFNLQQQQAIVQSAKKKLDDQITQTQLQHKPPNTQSQPKSKPPQTQSPKSQLAEEVMENQ